jgi:hypothetical protein
MYSAAVEIDRARLVERFRDMSDEELLANMRNELTDVARELAVAEATRRGLDLPQAGAEKDTENAEPRIEVPEGHGPLKLCARYLNPINAQVLAACLESHGLSAVVMDANTIFAAGVLFNSLPRGGVRVMVPESQLDAALKIRAAYDAGELAIDEDFDVGKGS